MGTSSATSRGGLHVAALPPASPAFTGSCPPSCLRITLQDDVTARSEHAGLSESGSPGGRRVSVGRQEVGGRHGGCRGRRGRRRGPGPPAGQRQVIQAGGFLPAAAATSQVTAALSQGVPGVCRRRSERRLGAHCRVGQPGSLSKPRHGEGQHGDKVCLGAMATEPACL